MPMITPHKHKPPHKTAQPTSAVMIRPGCRHRALGALTIINIPVPKHDAEDFFHDEDAVKDGEVPVH